MISGNALIECGAGSVHSIASVNSLNGMGVIAMKSAAPGPIGSLKSEISDDEFDSFMNNAEVLLFFHNIESLDSIMSTFTNLREMMVEERERLNKEENDE